MKGYKVFNPDWTCRGFKYEVGKEYVFNEEIKLCSSGFHFCRKLQHCFSYYSFDPNNKVAEIEAIGDVLGENEDKQVTNKIKIIKELSWQEVLFLANSGLNNTGSGNSGNRNSGNWNSGNRNSGNWNSGDRNSGYWNSGDGNSGYWNSGDGNSGNWNSGDGNSGNRNSGNGNSGNRNSGMFCSDTPKLRLFNQQTDLDYNSDIANNIINEIMLLPPLCQWIDSSSMSEYERETNKGWEACGGYLKKNDYKDCWKEYWSTATQDQKDVFLKCGYFDSDVFFEITGIRAHENKK